MAHSLPIFVMSARCLIHDWTVCLSHSAHNKGSLAVGCELSLLLSLADGTQELIHRG